MRRFRPLATFVLVQILIALTFYIVGTGDLRTDEDGWCYHFGKYGRFMVCDGGATDAVLGAR